jgi:hypothetical protein
VSKKLRWFKHDADARNSLKLRKVRRKYGADGYAIYWFCLEAIAYGIEKDNLTFDLKEDAETIGFELNIQEKRVEEIMMYMIEIGLFESSHGTITCLKLAERLDKSMTNSPLLRKWIGDKNVMTSADGVMTSADGVRGCHELDKIRLEVDKKEQKKNIKKKIDFSSLAMTSEQIEEIKDFRSKKKAPLTQRVVDTLATEFSLCRAAGMVSDQILNAWFTAGWQGFKSEWVLKNEKHNSTIGATKQPTTAAERLRARERERGANI